MPGWSHGPDGPVRTSGHRPVGRPAGRSGDVRAGLTVACPTRTGPTVRPDVSGVRSFPTHLILWNAMSLLAEFRVTTCEHVLI